MAQRRMFSKEVTNSSEFLMMSQGAQNLYFHFGMNADDDGFCEVFTVMRMTESKPDDLQLLHSRGFIYVVDGKVCIVKDWHENNQLRSDRYKPSKYLSDPKIAEIYAIVMKEKISKISQYSELLNTWQPNGNQMEPQDRIGKDRIGKKREEKALPPGKPEGSLSWLGTFNEKEEFVCGVPPETLKAFSEKYKASEDQIKNKCEDLVLWAQTSRKVKKNYKTFLQVILKKDFGIRTEADKILQERIDLTVGKSSPFAKSLAAKMKM